MKQVKQVKQVMTVVPWWVPGLRWRLPCSLFMFVWCWWFQLFVHTLTVDPIRCGVCSYTFSFSSYYLHVIYTIHYPHWCTGYEYRSRAANSLTPYQALGGLLVRTAPAALAYPLQRDNNLSAVSS